MIFIKTQYNKSMSVSERARIAKWNLGKSVLGRDYLAWAFAPEGRMSPPAPKKSKWPWFLLIAGVHGDEVEGCWPVQKILEGLLEEHPFENLGVVVVPEANPDGVAGNVRLNANNVDLNRNMPTKDWTPRLLNPRYPPGPSAGSEPETKYMVQLIEALQPVAILSAHSFSKPQVNVNGPALNWGSGIAALCGSEVTTDIGYPTPGCLGTYAGVERKIPTITLEIKRGMSENSVSALYTMTIATAISFWDKANPSVNKNEW